MIMKLHKVIYYVFSIMLCLCLTAGLMAPVGASDAVGSQTEEELVTAPVVDQDISDQTEEGNQVPGSSEDPEARQEKTPEKDAKSDAAPAADDPDAEEPGGSQSEEAGKNEKDEKKDEKEEKDEEEKEERDHRYPEDLEGEPLSGAEAIVEIAQREYDAYGMTACGSRYWSGHELCAWSADFVEYCANELGYVGKDQVFGTKCHRPYELVYNLIQNGASVYYPGDGITPEPGDIVTWWCGGRPGTKYDWKYWAMHTGLVTEATGDTVTVIEGSVWSWAPTKAVLAKNTYSITGPLSGNIYIQMFLRPDYPMYGGKIDPEKIQNALISLLYDDQGGMVCCDYDSYSNIEGRHEGIDFCSVEDAKLYAVTSGEIIRITEGEDGSLSTICVYDEKYDKTVVYLHTDPDDSLEVGQMLRYGDYIGVEASRGATSAHTHIEVVDGYSLAANVSVNDDTLDNETPYYYWAARLSTTAAPEVIRIIHE